MSERQFTRREVVERLLAGLATGAAWPLAASSHPIHEHFRNSALLDRADATLAAAGWRPVFLNAEQNEVLTSLAETMVPGAAKAQVNRFIDLLLSVDTRDHQQQFLESLFAVVFESRQKFARPVRGLTDTERSALLTGIAADESQRSHFLNLKDWIVGAYYSSEDGMRELGWDGSHAFAKFPGCQHESQHSGSQ